MRLIVTNPESFADQGSVWTAEGHTEDGTQVVTFAGDHRPMRALHEAVEAGEECWVDPESWAVQSIRPVDAPLP